MTELLFSIALTLTMLPLAFFFSCSSCCGCTIWDDTFSTDLTSTDYDIRSGSFVVTGGNLDTTAADSLIIADTPFAINRGVVRVQISFGAMATGDKLRIVGAYKDDSNYLVGEVHKTSASLGNLELLAVVAGVETSLIAQTGFTLNLSVDYCLSWDGTYAALACDGGHVREEFTPDTDGFQAGLGSGDTVTGTVRFQRFILARSPEESSACLPCTICTPCSDLQPDEITVEISGVTNGTCAQCTSFNTTWVLSPVTGNSCSYSIIPGLCSAGNLTYRLVTQPGSDSSQRLSCGAFDSGQVNFGVASITCESRTETLSSFTSPFGTCGVGSMVADITFNP